MIDPDKIPPELWKQMNISKERFLEIQKAVAAREARAPAVGAPAPDFELEQLSSDGERTGKRVRLSGHRGRPVALVFGSYT
jgi:hypothetical protein